MGPSLLERLHRGFGLKPELTIALFCFTFCRALCDEGFRAVFEDSQVPWT